MIDQPVSQRVSAIAAAKPFGLLFGFFNDFDYGERRQRPGMLDFTFGDPHDMPSRAYVEALGRSLTPQNELWFAYKQNERGREAAAASHHRSPIRGRRHPSHDRRVRRDRAGDEDGRRPR